MIASASAQATARPRRSASREGGAARSPRQETGVQSIVMALEILEYLARQPDPVGVAAIAAALHITKSRVYRHLRTLLARGYIYQAGSFEKYQIGSRLVSLSHAVTENFQLAHVANAAITQLREALGHFTVLSERDRDGMRVVATRAGKSMLEVQVKQGSLLPYHASAQGKLCLAFGEPALLDQVCRARLEAMTPYSITNARALRAEVERVRRNGYATAFNESLVGTNSLAAPILGPGQVFRGTVAVIDSVQFLPQQPSRKQIARVIAAARQITKLLGGDAADVRVASSKA
jgi:DNA-binding IclR family transcriptional regulator